jgi:hypothetical protein
MMVLLNDGAGAQDVFQYDPKLAPYHGMRSDLSHPWR